MTLLRRSLSRDYTRIFPWENSVSITTTSLSKILPEKSVLTKIIFAHAKIIAIEIIKLRITVCKVNKYIRVCTDVMMYFRCTSVVLMNSASCAWVVRILLVLTSWAAMNGNDVFSRKCMLCNGAFTVVRFPQTSYLLRLPYWHDECPPHIQSYLPRGPHHTVRPSTFSNSSFSPTSLNFLQIHLPSMSPE